MSYSHVGREGIKTCILDWRSPGNWTTWRRRRYADLVSCWVRWTEPPIVGARTIPTWGWNSFFSYNLDGLGEPLSFYVDPTTIDGAWGAMVLENDWHVFDGSYREIYDGGTFKTYAVDFRNQECAEACADHIVDWPTNGFISGVHIDYYLNPYSLGALSFADWEGTGNPALFDSGLAAFARRLRERMPNGVILGQLDQRTTQELEDPLSGYFMEQYIGKFNPPQTSYETVQGWITSHANYIAENHPGREHVTVLEFGDAAESQNTVQNFGGYTDTTEQALENHIEICQNTGAYLSYGRDEYNLNIFRGYRPTRSVRSHILRAISVSTSGSWTVVGAPSIEALFTGNYPDAYVESPTNNGYVEITVEALPSDVLDVFNVAVVARTKKFGTFNTGYRMGWQPTGGALYTGMYRNVVDQNNLIEEFVPPQSTSSEWTLSKCNNMKLRITNVSGIYTLRVHDLYVRVQAEVATPTRISPHAAATLGWGRGGKREKVTVDQNGE